jgi:hypothetical protein
VFGSVSATRFGIMNGTFDDGLPSANTRRPVCSLSLTVKVFGFAAVIVSTKLITFWPSESFAAQRLIEATQSSAVTGAPSCQRRPSRKRESIGELVRTDVVFVDHLRLDLALVVHREERVVDHVAVVARDVRGGPDRIDDLDGRNASPTLSVVSALARRRAGRAGGAAVKNFARALVMRIGCLQSRDYVHRCYRAAR